MAKPRAVALLRAINVGGHTVTMERLRALFADMGFGGVETLIASGNVLFEARRGDSAKLEARIEATLYEALGYEVATMLRTAAEVDDLLQRAPRGGTTPGAGVDGVAESVMVGFLKTVPRPSAASALEKLETETDSLTLDGRELYWMRTGRISDSKLAGGLLEKTLGTAMTMRNITTVRKIAAKLGAGLGGSELR